MVVDRERFEQLAAEAIDGLPAWVRARMENVEVTIEDLPPRDEPGLLGLYHGIPLTERDGGYAGVLPDRITLYRATILRHAGHDGRSARLLHQKEERPFAGDELGLSEHELGFVAETFSD